jgi:hypothetical protein
MRETDSTGRSGSRRSPGRFDILGQAIVDDEAAVIKDVRTSFSELQAALAGGKQGRISAEIRKQLNTVISPTCGLRSRQEAKATWVEPYFPPKWKP